MRVTYIGRTKRMCLLKERYPKKKEATVKPGTLFYETEKATVKPGTSGNTGNNMRQSKADKPGGGCVPGVTLDIGKTSEKKKL